MTKDKASPKSAKDDLVALINMRIENLRLKLLDLTRRNPLLSTKFSDRSHSHIRIVDGLPQILFERLIEGKMKFVSLPPLEADPKDEQSRKFKKALSYACLTDEIYIEALEAIDQDAEDSAEKLAIAERELKDRIRENLKMPARQTKTSLSLVYHARNNDIRTAYDLPLPNEENLDGRHQDEAMQTLLLGPDMLEKRLNSIMSKCNTWIEETGIHVLRAAFGFLEWTESASSEPALAPLILLPVEIEKKKTREGFEYTVFSLGENHEINTVLIEKLKREFGIDLPVFNPEETLENYFKEVGRITLRGMTWQVRRQVAIGVFPSARMAMYHDLDTKSWDFHTHEVISGLLGGKNTGNGSTPFGDEYEIDHPDVEIKVPMIVTDADASQFSVIVDVMNDKSVAVEGPPGSGKSQTIVNTIAVALSHGKKVLFVAEKTAALEVVRSRLEACRLGEFLLTLQATRSSKEKIIESIRERIQIPAEKEPPGLDEKIQQFKTIRTQLNKYIQIISSQFANTDFTIHDVLGYCMHAQKKLSNYAQELSQVHVAGVRSITQEKVNEIVHLCNQLETAWEKANRLKPYWNKVQNPKVRDDSGYVQCVWFEGIQWVKDAFEVGEMLAVSAVPTLDKLGRPQFVHPEFDRLRGALEEDEPDWGKMFNTGAIIPKYSSTSDLGRIGLDSRGFRRILRTATQHHTDGLTDPLPKNIRTSRQLPGLSEALKAIHFPADFADLENARTRLKFD